MPKDVSLDDLEPWLMQACASVGVDRSRVDVGMALKLSREAAHRLARPMAPVSTYIAGLALGADPDADPRTIAAALEATLPPPENSADAGPDKEE